MSPDTRAKLPELSVSIMSGMARLFLAESEMVAVEKGILEHAASLTAAKVSGIYKDIMNRLDEAAGFFEEGLNSLKSSTKSNFKQYYVSYCRAMRICYEVLSYVASSLNRSTSGTLMRKPSQKIRRISDSDAWSNVSRQLRSSKDYI